jgi:hypothetical protein
LLKNRESLNINKDDDLEGQLNEIISYLLIDTSENFAIFLSKDYYNEKYKLLLMELAKTSNAKSLL